MGHQDDPVRNRSDRLVTLFPFHIAILRGCGERIVEYVPRQLEIDAMLGPILPILVRVPLEEHCVYKLVYTPNRRPKADGPRVARHQVREKRIAARSSACFPKTLPAR